MPGKGDFTSHFISFLYAGIMDYQRFSGFLILQIFKETRCCINACSQCWMILYTLPGKQTFSIISCFTHTFSTAGRTNPTVMKRRAQGHTTRRSASRQGPTVHSASSPVLSLPFPLALLPSQYICPSCAHSFSPLMLRPTLGLAPYLVPERAAKMDKARFMPLSSSRSLVPLIGNRRKQKAPWADKANSWGWPSHPGYAHEVESEDDSGAPSS